MCSEVERALSEQGACDGGPSGGMIILPSSGSGSVAPFPGMGYMLHVRHHEGHIEYTHFQSKLFHGKIAVGVFPRHNAIHEGGGGERVLQSYGMLLVSHKNKPNP